MVNFYQLNYRNLRFYHQSEQASESALVEINSDETEKRPGGVPIMLNRTNEDSLSAQMLELYESLLPTEESAKKREAFASKIEKILNEEWPGHDIKVHMFGSSMNDLGTTQSDVDLCVTTLWNGLKDIYVLSECLRKHGMRIEQTVSKAKVPIVRLSDPNLNLACDINVNNTLALHNTRLIRKYVDIDPRVRPLAMIVKHWARRRVLNDAAKGGTISTYTWTCIILNFLQMRDPPILPVLHKLPHEGVEQIIVNGEDASFCEDVEKLKKFGEKNRESVGGLLFAFFRRMAFEFDYDNHVISLRQGKYLTKAEKGWDTCKGWKMLCVEEPFNTARNLGNSADDVSVNGLKTEFRRAYDILYESASLDMLCEEYRFQYNNIHYNNHYNNHYHNHYNKNYNNNRIYYKPNKRNLRTNSTGHVKSGNRNPCMKPLNGQQNEQTNYTTDNFHDMNGKSNFSQDNEEDRSSMPRFHVDNVPQNGHYSTINGSGIAPISDVDHVKRDLNTFRKQFDNQNKRERNGFTEVNDSQIQHHNVSLDMREDEHPQIKSVKNNNFHRQDRQGYIKRKNDERPLYSDQSNNYVRHSQDSDSSAYKSNQDTISNQNQSFYKNNNQKADNNWQNRSRSSHSDQKSSHSQNTNASYGSYNYSRRQNTSSDMDQKSLVAYNSGYHKQKSSLNKQDYGNSKQVEDSNSNSILSSRSKPSSSIVDDSSNFDRSNPSPKPVYKSNNYNHKNNNKQHTQFNSKSPQQFQKPAENFDFANNTYPPYPVLPHNGTIVMVPMSSDSMYPANHSNGFLPSQNTIPTFTPTFQNHHGQLNDGTANYLRRNSHQSSSDGSNSQTSGNTSNTSYSNSSYTKHGNQKNIGNSGNQNQNNYHQQPRQNKLNNNGFNNNGKKRRNNNNNNNNYNYANSNNGYINSGNGNYRPNNTTNNPSPVVAPNVNDSTLNYHEDPIILNLNISPSVPKVGNDYNGDANGFKAYNNNSFKSYNNSNNSNSWKNSNTTSSRTINGINSTNGPKSANGGNNSSNRNVNGNNSNNNYSRSNGNNYNNNNYNASNLHKSVNGNNCKTVEVSNNFNTQTKNFNNNNHSNSIKNGGNNNSGNTNVQRNNNGYYCNKSNRSNKNMRRNSNANFKVEKKEDGFNQQQYSQETQLSSQRQNYNIQSHQQNNNHQQESGSKPKNLQRKKVGQKRNTHKEFQQQQ